MGLPLLLFEDDHLLVVAKPAGLNTHAPSPYAGEGLYDWLRHRDPRWAALAIVHRLDKETSGVLVFGKTALANRSLTRQFTEHQVHKEYLLVTDRPVRFDQWTARSSLVRAGDRYVVRPAHPGAPVAETRFTVCERTPERTVIKAEPLTGRTHQIRAQAAAEGFPILGDILYGGSGPAGPTGRTRVWLHAQRLAFRHPATDAEVGFEAPLDFAAAPALALRQAMVDAEATNACRWLHGAADGWPGCYVDRLGDFLLVETGAEVAGSVVGGRASAGLGDRAFEKQVRGWLADFPIRGVYRKRLDRRVGDKTIAQVSPAPWLGEAAPDRFVVRENGLEFELSFLEGSSVGLFLDQRDNRRRLLTGHIGSGFPLFPNGAAGQRVLNAFAYTCAFSVCAAKAGAVTTSLDLSRKYLDWGRRNFERNRLDAAAHDFIFGDVFDWLGRLGRKGRRYDVIVLDPPTFSRSKSFGVFRAEADYGRLVQAALPLLEPGGVLLASTNAASLVPELFLEKVSQGTQAARRRIVQQLYVPQPPDFPICRVEPGHLKTVWLRVD